MTRFSRVQVWSTMEEQGLVPLFYNADVEVARSIVGALHAGGARLVEFTNRGDRAFQVFQELVVDVEQRFPDLILGVGSVLDAPTAAMYINLGASFIVGSVTNPDVARLCNSRKIVYCPGCATPTEIFQAEELGVEIVKIFPASHLGGPGFVKSVKAPCPWVKIMPTGGVKPTWDNLKSWFDAGVTCVGMGSKLIRKDLIAAEDWDTITTMTAQSLEWIGQARGGPKAEA